MSVQTLIQPGHRNPRTQKSRELDMLHIPGDDLIQEASPVLHFNLPEAHDVFL